MWFACAAAAAVCCDVFLLVEVGAKKVERKPRQIDRYAEGKKDVLLLNGRRARISADIHVDRRVYNRVDMHTKL